MSAIVDLGCGTGSAGAGWALESRTSRVSGIDRHPWAVLEATWTYRTLDLRGRARQGDFSRALLRAVGGSGIVAAYAINETAADRREHLQKSLVEAHREGASVLIVEPIARSIAPWWEQWRRAFAEEGGRSDEWRFPADLPSRQRALARAAGLDPQELTARSLWLCGRH
jgi:hypothetical protein